MLNGVAANTHLAGAPRGTFRDDLTDRDIGQWPKTLAIKRISRIVVYSGDVIDSLRITYELTTGPAKTIQHGGDGGGMFLNLPIAANQKLVAVYGRQLKGDCVFGTRNIVQLSFVIATQGPADSRDAATVDIKTVSTNKVTNPNTPFDLTWALVAANSYSDQPSDLPHSYLQGLGFSKVLGQAAL